MCLLGATTFWLVVVAVVRGNRSDFGHLIARIHLEIDTGTVYFVGVRDVRARLSEISASGVVTPVKVFTRPPTSDAPVEKTVVLVVQGPWEHAHEGVVDALRHRKFVVVIVDDVEALRAHFLLLAEKKFTRIYGVAADVAFAYLPYADRPVQRLAAEGPLPDGLGNFNGFPVRSTVQTDIPRVFRYQDQRGEWAIGGPIGQLFLSFLQKHNATLTEVIINKSRILFIPGIVNATISGDIDVSMNTYNPLEGVLLSYPLGLMQYTIMVPLNGQVDPHQYFVRPFSPAVWIFIAFTVAYIVVMNILTDYYADAPVLWWPHFSRTLLTLLNMSGGTRLTTSYRLQAQVHLLAFILANLYTVHLTSFLTVFINVKQYETIQDLIDNDVRVMMTDYEWDEIAAPGEHKPGFENIVTLVDGPVYTRERNSMRNTSFAYAAGMDKAEFLLRLQQTYDKPRFRTIRDSLEDFYLGFLLAEHSIFHEILDQFIIEVKPTGLEEKWTRDAVVQASKAGLIDVKYVPQQGQTPLTINHLGAAWTCLIAGLATATVVFVLESGLGWVWRVCCGLC